MITVQVLKNLPLYHPIITIVSNLVWSTICNYYLIRPCSVVSSFVIVQYPFRTYDSSNVNFSNHRYYHQNQHSLWMIHQNNIERRIDDKQVVVVNERCNNIPHQVSNDDAPLTNGLLRVSYDGSRFTGWCSGNDSNDDGTVVHDEDNINLSGRKRRRARARNENGANNKGFVRSVQGVIRNNLAKLYGNIDVQRIVVEGSSRTDKGVHARGMVVHFYSIKQDIWDAISCHDDTSISSSNSLSAIDVERLVPGKRMPHPQNSTDTSYFDPLPKPLEKIAFALNRMCNEIQIFSVAEPPSATTSVENIPFHSSVSAISKTYQYYFSIGPIHDPTQTRRVWHIEEHCNTEFNASLFRSSCLVLEGEHDFSAFQGVSRNADEKQKHRLHPNTVCVIQSITLNKLSTWKLDSLPSTTTYVVSITGNRFLYKMVRFMVGILIAIATNKTSVDDLALYLDPTENTALQQLQQHRSFECAPARGLILHEVMYDPPIAWKSPIS